MSAGVTGTVLSFVKKALMPICSGFSRHEMYKLPLERDLTGLFPSPDGIKFEWVTQENVSRISYWLGPREVRRWRRLLNRGQTGIFAVADGQVVGYNLCSVRTTPWTIDCLHNPIQVGEALFHTGGTQKRYRKRGIMTNMLVRHAQYLQQHYASQGIKRVCGIIVPENHAQRRVLNLIGFTKTHEFIATRVFINFFVRWIWEVDPEDGRRKGMGRLSVKFKIPEVLWDPVFDRFSRKPAVTSLSES